MEDIIKQKDEEIKRLHEVYDIENVLRQIEVLNEENDKMYEELMMLKNQLYIVKTRFNSYKHRIKSVLEVLHKYVNLTYGDENVGANLLEWAIDSESDEDEDN